MSIPFFPPLCIVPPVETLCTYFGLTIPCVPAVVTVESDGDANVFGMEIQMGHWLTFILLMVIGLLTLSYAKWPFRYADAMKVTVGLYSIITAIFALSRLGFHVSRLLLITAALHNLPEWAILVQISAANTTSHKVQTGLRAATFFIIAVIFVVVMMPQLGIALIVEQSVGIMLDFALPLVFWWMYITGSSQVRSFYKLPAVAHTVHLLFTIIPLVVANFYVGHTSWFSTFLLEIMIYVSAPITHTLYARWSFDFDDCKQTATEKDKPIHVIPMELRAKNIVRFLVVGFLLGLVPLIAVPAMIGFCPATPHCTHKTDVIGTSVAVVHPGFDVAFEDLVAARNLVESAQVAKGNRGYELVKDIQNPNTFRFVEHWDSAVNRNAWLEKVHTAVFEEPAMKNLLVGGKLSHFEVHSHYQPSECRDSVAGAISFDVAASCDKLWGVVSNWSDCTWVSGCLYAVPDPRNNSRVLHMQTGSTFHQVLRKIDVSDRELIYEEAPSGGRKGFTGHIKAAETGRAPGCHSTYRFVVAKGGVNLDYVYDDLLNVQVPRIKKVFNKN